MNIRSTEYGTMKVWKSGSLEVWKCFLSPWEGTSGELMQVSGVYVWLCHYQFDGETETSKAGTVFLLR